MVFTVCGTAPTLFCAYLGVSESETPHWQFIQEGQVKNALQTDHGLWHIAL